MSDAKGLRGRVADATARLARAGTRLVPGARGETLPGRLALGVDPDLLARRGRGLATMIVTGTNGKTTATAIARSLVGEPVVSNHGSNLPWGVAASLVAGPRGARFGVFEVDEAFVPRVAEALRPRVLVVLNLSRDQLDRALEVRRLAARIAEASQWVPTVVANASDPLVVHLAASFAEQRFIQGDREWWGDATACPRCQHALERADTWRCRGCGLTEPTDVTAVDVEGEVTRGGRSHGRLVVGLPGTFNLFNGLAAAVGVEVLTGRPLEEVVGRARPISGVEGRYGSWVVPTRQGEIALVTLLAKNPAGWDRMLAMTPFDEQAVVLGLNAEVADGRDTSWIWDVDFESAKLATAIVTGRRALDLAVRLEVAGVEVACTLDQREALAMAARSARRVTYLGNYTAFREMVSLLPRIGGLATVWSAS